MIIIFKLCVAPTQGHLRIRVHDEAYAIVHSGTMGFNFDFFIARLCFKGGTYYNINILQVINVDVRFNFRRNLTTKYMDFTVKNVKGFFKEMTV